MLYDKIVDEIYENGLELKEQYLCGLDGLIVGDTIYTEKSYGSYKKNEIMRHELEHYYTNPYNLIEAPPLLREKMEKKAARRAVFALIPLDKLISCWDKGIRDEQELSDELELEIQYIFQALRLYHSIFGFNYVYSGRIINFLPLSID